jgi:hypothetical protein
MNRLPACVLTIALSTGLAACGGGLVAPEGPATNAFLDQVGNRCGKLNIGSQPIDYLLSDASDDTYFVDETSKLAAGEIDSATFADDINTFYPAGDNQAAITCITGLLD